MLPSQINDTEKYQVQINPTVFHEKDNKCSSFKSKLCYAYFPLYPLSLSQILSTVLLENKCPISPAQAPKITVRMQLYPTVTESSTMQDVS